MTDTVLSIDDLKVALPAWSDRKFAVGGVSVDIRREEILCIVGESGSGKSMMGGKPSSVCSPHPTFVLSEAGSCSKGATSSPYRMTTCAPFVVAASP